MRRFNQWNNGYLPERPGEPDCAYYLRTGTCGYGARCWYNHPRDRSRAVGGDVHFELGGYPQRYGRPACQYYLRTGTCKFGAFCKFHHPRSAGGSSSLAPLNTYGYPLHEGEEKCPSYLRTCYCKFGEVCKCHRPEPVSGLMAAPAFQFYPKPQFHSPDSQYYNSGSTLRRNTKMEKKLKIKIYKKKKQSLTSLPPPWLDLPRDITANILHRLGAIEMLQNAQKVCTTWRDICKDPSMWRVISMSATDEHYFGKYKTMCCQAVDQSQGQLEEIELEYFGSDELLIYIARRSSHLRRMHLACSFHASSEVLVEAVRQLPMLEELFLFHLPCLSKEAIETVGRSCSKLKSLTLNRRRHEDLISEFDDDVAIAVGQNMPKLHHLQLLGNPMTNDGLRAILDGCPLLESLDLRRCCNLDLGGDIWKRCSQQIKYLRAPRDSLKGYRYRHEVFYDSENDSLYSEESSYDISDYHDYTLPFHSDSENDSLHSEEFTDDTSDYHDDTLAFHSESDYEFDGSNGWFFPIDEFGLY